MIASPNANGSPPIPIDDPRQLMHGGIEPPSGFIVTAIARHKLLVLMSAIVVAAIGTTFGVSRPSTYTASATLQVGQVNPNSPGFYSYVTSASALATDFSRAVGAAPVLAEVQKRLKLAPSTAASRLSGEPLPQSPAFRVIATGPSESAAIALADVAAGAVQTYESQSNTADPEAEALLGEYKAASLALQHSAASLTRLERAGHNQHSTAALTPSGLVAAKAEKDTAAAKLAAIGAAYTAAVASEAPRAGLVSLVAGASSASNDRHSKIEIFGFVALLIGIVLGCALAIGLERARSQTPVATGTEVETQHSSTAV
jgi:capsular polysaccharide biosynthesis protein